ncbi:MAG: hypothetical protein UHJ11_01555 [Paludibacteraceae bacterium]|nr:hypothetical protein [Paludibacteraceae bacterium]
MNQRLSAGNEKNRISRTYSNIWLLMKKMSCMEAYEAVGYRFYKQADAIRRILGEMNKTGKNAHNKLN